MWFIGLPCESPSQVSPITSEFLFSSRPRDAYMLGHAGFRQWLVACSAPSRQQSQSYLNVNKASWNNFSHSWITIQQRSFKKWLWICRFPTVCGSLIHIAATLSVPSHPRGTPVINKTTVISTARNIQSISRTLHGHMFILVRLQAYGISLVSPMVVNNYEAFGNNF